MSNEVFVFYERQSKLVDHLLSVKELTLAQDAEQMLQKNLPLAAASYFEHRVTGALQEFVKKRSGGSPELQSFFEQKAIKRQYHTLFDWEKPNVNKFLSHFGEAFKAVASAEISGDPELNKAARDFLELGNMRNCIVHQNYATYLTNKSAAEIFALFTSAERFVNYIKEKLN